MLGGLQGELMLRSCMKRQKKSLQNSLSNVGMEGATHSSFLRFWINLLPDANFLLIYRSPWKWLIPLSSRDEIFLDQPELAVKIWMHYNQKF